MGIMGVLIGCAVAPIAMCLMWKKTNKWGAICGAFGGQWLGLISWVLYAKIGYGEVNYNNTFEDYTMLTGNVVSLVMGGLICYVWSMISPENYDFESMKHIKMIDDEDAGGHHGFTEEGVDSMEAMDAALNFVLKWGGLLAFILIPVWPLLALPAGVFSEGYFFFWVILSMIWGIAATFIATFMPIIESRETLMSILAHMM